MFRPLVLGSFCLGLWWREGFGVKGFGILGSRIQGFGVTGGFGVWGFGVPVFFFKEPFPTADPRGFRL